MKTEAAILEQLVKDLEAKIEDPFIEQSDFELAEKALQEAKDRLSTLYDSGLLPAEQRVTVDGKSGIVNQFGYTEPDIANPHSPVEPLSQVIEPELETCPETCPNHEQIKIDTGALLESNVKEAKVDTKLAATHILDLPKAEDVAKTLGVEGLRQSQLYSQLQVLFPKECDTPLGNFALRLLIENSFLQTNLGEMSKLTSSGVAKLNLIHRIEAPAKNKGRR